MNELLRKNLEIIKTLKHNEQIMAYFKFKNDKLYIDDLEIDLTLFDLNEVLNENVLNNLENLDINDIKKLFNIAMKKEEVMPKFSKYRRRKNN